MNNGKIDKILFLNVAALIFVGLIIISSASVVLSYKNFGNNYHYVNHQFFYGVLPGIFLMYIFAKKDYIYLKKYAPYFLILSLASLFVVFLPGIGLETKGASRWIVVAGMSFQPSELAKISFIIYISAWFVERRKKINDLNETFLPLLLIIGMLAVPILLQPDFDTLIVISAIAFIIYFVSGASYKYIFAMITGGFLAFLVLIKIAPYRMNRLMVFLHPEIDPQNMGYQINQSLLALGSGGILGLGFGHSRQKFNYLPEPMGDSVFAITGEEFGMIGAILVVFLFLVFATRGIKIIEETHDDFGKLLATGMTSLIILQAFMNIGAITSLIPLTGTPLPFISYGGSSILASSVAVGILLSISKYGVKKR